MVEPGMSAMGHKVRFAPRTGHDLAQVTSSLRAAEKQKSARLIGRFEHRRVLVSSCAETESKRPDNRLYCLHIQRVCIFAYPHSYPHHYFALRFGSVYLPRPQSANLSTKLKQIWRSSGSMRSRSPATHEPGDPSWRLSHCSISVTDAFQHAAHPIAQGATEVSITTIR
jgi:hypothetical protein